MLLALFIIEMSASAPAPLQKITPFLENGKPIPTLQPPSQSLQELKHQLASPDQSFEQLHAKYHQALQKHQQILIQQIQQSKENLLSTQRINLQIMQNWIKEKGLTARQIEKLEFFRYISGVIKGRQKLLPNHYQESLTRHNIGNVLTLLRTHPNGDRERSSFYDINEEESILIGMKLIDLNENILFEFCIEKV